MVGRAARRTLDRRPREPRLDRELSHGSHAYSQEIFFYWEGLAMFAVYVAIVWLLARPAQRVAPCRRKILRVLEELHAGVHGDGPRPRKPSVRESQNGQYARRGALVAAGSRSRAALLGGALAAHPAATAPAPRAQGAFVSAEVRDLATGRWYLVQTGPVPWSRNRRVSLKVITDISEQKHASSLRQQHRDMLHRTARLAALTEIASTLAHEVNQPLMAIASYTDACLRLLAQPEARSRRSRRGDREAPPTGDPGSEMISRMREFIRSRHPQPRECDVNAVVRESLDLADVHLEEAGVNVEVALAKDLPATHADPTLLAQVVINLLQNAIDAMRGCAQQERSCRVSTGVNSDGSILVSVADRGGGSPDGIGDAPYQPFFTTKPQGLGLGLSICRSVVEAHGGHLWHEADPEGGCIFRFTVPPEHRA
ncbi:MAG: ATP-binding protein [Burkholderiales bacterium]